MRGCAVSRRYIYIYVCYCDVFSIGNMYLDHIKFYVVCVNGRKYVCCSACYVVSNECDEPACYLVQPVGVVKLCTLGVFALGVSLVSWIVMTSSCVL